MGLVSAEVLNLLLLTGLTLFRAGLRAAEGTRLILVVLMVTGEATVLSPG